MLSLFKYTLCQDVFTILENNASNSNTACGICADNTPQLRQPAFAKVTEFHGDIENSFKYS